LLKDLSAIRTIYYSLQPDFEKSLKVFEGYGSKRGLRNGQKLLLNNVYNVYLKRINYG